MFVIYEQGSGVSVIPQASGNETLQQVANRLVPSGAKWREIQSLPSAAQEQWRWTDEGPLNVAEPPSAIVSNLSFAQLLIGLVTEGWITEAEGEAWLVGTLPTAVTDVISALPENQRFAAKARATRPSDVQRNDPLVTAMGAAADKTPEQLDEFFRTYAGV